jgi:hypothetical protein
MEKANVFRREQPAVGVRGVHLDLKGVPPTFGRLMKLLEIFAAAKFNCILVEWEDAFPWEDERFRSETAYSAEQVVQFHQKARDLGLQIVPLVQSLGHMETPLRLEEYRGLREVPDRCDVLNPLASGARELVERMVEDVLRRSGPITHFHLGGDEAWTFGTHPQTRAYIDKHGKGALYLHHVEPLCDLLLARGIRPILWHDMMHEWDEAALARIKDKADLMVWSYQGHPDAQTRGAFSTKTIERFHKAGIALWGAAAYKGADSRGDADLPDMNRRMANVNAWGELASRFKLQGLVATAWSRYSTHRVQCEPIDGALDVLVQTGAVWHEGEKISEDECAKVLESVGELERFRTCRAALVKLAEARKEAWYGVLLCREQAVCERLDERRRGSGAMQGLIKFAQGQAKAMESAAAELRVALEGLVDEVWIARYFAERIEPVTEAMKSL